MKYNFPSIPHLRLLDLSATQLRRIRNDFKEIFSDLKDLQKHLIASNISIWLHHHWFWRIVNIYFWFLKAWDKFNSDIQQTLQCLKVQKNIQLLTFKLERFISSRYLIKGLQKLFNFKQLFIHMDVIKKEYFYNIFESLNFFCKSKIMC